MGGRRVYHARGKVLGGSSSINGMIFQRGNPLDYERWASDAGMETWDHAHCLPYFKRMENCLAAAPTTRSAATTGRSCSSAARPRARCSTRSSRPCSRPATRSPTTSTATARRASRRSTATCTAGRRLSAARAYLHPVMDRPQPEGRDARARARGSCSRATRAVGVEYGRGARPGASGRRGAPVRRRDQLAAAAPALGRRRGRRAALARHRRRARPARGRREPAGPPRGLRPALVHAAGVDGAVLAMRRRPIDRARVAVRARRARAPPTTSRRGGFVRSNDDVAYPNLMYHFLPIAVRYDGTLPPGGGGHGYQVHVGPMYSDVRGIGEGHVSADPRKKPALRFNYLSTENDRREWVEAIRVDAQDPGQPALGRSTAASCRRGRRWRPTSRSWTGWHATPRPRCTRRAPAGWARTRCRSSTRSRCGCTALEGLRVVDASVDSRT